MTKNFLRSTQYLICLNLLCQLFWLAHLNWPDFFHLYLEQLIYLVTSVGIIHTVSGIFIGIYLFKKQFRNVFDKANAITISLEYLNNIDRYGVNDIAQLHNEALVKNKRLSIIGFGQNSVYNHFKSETAA